MEGEQIERTAEVADGPLRGRIVLDIDYQPGSQHVLDSVQRHPDTVAVTGDAVQNHECHGVNTTPCGRTGVSRSLVTVAALPSQSIRENSEMS